MTIDLHAFARSYLAGRVEAESEEVSDIVSGAFTLFHAAGITNHRGSGVFVIGNLGLDRLSDIYPVWINISHLELDERELAVLASLNELSALPRRSIWTRQ